jgi:hypothetical protein
VTRPTPLQPLSSEEADLRSRRTATQKMVRFLERRVRRLARARQQAYADRLMRQLDNSTKNCFQDCDFPGECSYQQTAGLEFSESEAESDTSSATVITDEREATNAPDGNAEDFEIWVDHSERDSQSSDGRARVECDGTVSTDIVE